MEVQWRNRPFYKSNQCKIPRKEDQRRILQGKSLAGGKGLKQHLLKFFSSYLFWGFSAVGSPDPLSKHSNKASLPERNTKLLGKKQNAPGVLGRGPGRGQGDSYGGKIIQKEVLEYKHCPLTWPLLSPSALSSGLQGTLYCVIALVVLIPMNEQVEMGQRKMDGR